MDFSPDEGQQAVAAVVTSVLSRDNSWDALVAGGVTALAVPERLGGDGLGLAEIATALTEIGRHGTISPALATLGLGTAVLLDLASDAQQDRYLRGVAKGSVLTAALNEPGAPLADRPATTLANGRLNEAQDVWDHVQLSARDRWREISTPGGPVRAMLEHGWTDIDVIPDLAGFPRVLAARLAP